MADTTTLQKPAQEPAPKASGASGTAPDKSVSVAPAPDGAETAPQQVPHLIERLSNDVQALPQAAEKASAELAQVPQTVITTLPGELTPIQGYIEAKLPIAKAMPLADILYGGGVLVAVVIVQAIGVRLLTGHVDKRSHGIRKRPAVWRVELLFGIAVFLLLSLHLGSVLLWSAALVYGGIVPEWVQAARYAAYSYTTIGSDLVLPEMWQMIGPIIAISGMFNFAWTASILVSLITQCNDLRRLAWDARQNRRAARRHTRPTAPPEN